MHKVDKVLITKTGKYYHYMDDDCPTTARILSGELLQRRFQQQKPKKEATHFVGTVQMNMQKIWLEGKGAVRLQYYSLLQDSVCLAHRLFIKVDGGIRMVFKDIIINGFRV